MLDGRRRFDVRVTLILDPGLALVAWVHYAPPLSDSFRKSYRQFLRWNDELPFAKFALSADERPVLTSEIPVERLDRDRLGLTLARLLAMCDLLLDESLHWLWPGGRRPPADVQRTSRHASLLDRYRDELAELVPGMPATDPGDDEGSPAGTQSPDRADATEPTDPPDDRGSPERLAAPAR